jgi:hypothetical protein
MPYSPKPPETKIWQDSRVKLTRIKVRSTRTLQHKGWRVIHDEKNPSQIEMVKTGRHLRIHPEARGSDTKKMRLVVRRFSSTPVPVRGGKTHWERIPPTKWHLEAYKELAPFPLEGIRISLATAGRRGKQREAPPKPRKIGKALPKTPESPEKPKNMIPFELVGRNGVPVPLQLRLRRAPSGRPLGDILYGGTVVMTVQWRRSPMGPSRYHIVSGVDSPPKELSNVLGVRSWGERGSGGVFLNKDHWRSIMTLFEDATGMKR